MSGSVLIRWLPAILLVSAVPVVSRAQFAFNGATENSEIGTGSGDIPVSVRATEQLPQLTPEDLGDIYMVRQRYQAAMQEYLKVEHRSAATWNKLGIAYQMMHDTKDAAHCYKESIKLDAANFTVLNNLATDQDAEKDFSAAERTYRKSLKVNPNSAITLKNLGTNLLMQHQYEKASAMYGQALALDPKIFDDHFGPKANDPAPKEEHGTAAYFKARTCARAGLNDCAVTFLLKAFNEGSATVKKVSEESDFTGLMGTPALTRLFARQQ